MKHETPLIKAEPRTRMGSRYSQRLRKTGRLPAVVYGHKTDPVHVSVDEKETLTLLQHGTHVLELEIEGMGRETCLVKELQFGYLGDNVIHVDFARVNLEEEVRVAVRLHFTGSPIAATKPGAIVTHVVTDLDVICKVKDIPGEIKVDITPMETVFLVRDLSMPPNVRPALPGDAVIARISFVAEEEVTPTVGEEAAVAEAVVAEPVVTTEIKAEERQKAKEATGGPKGKEGAAAS